jgi:hypothetical protein
MPRPFRLSDQDVPCKAVKDVLFSRALGQPGDNFYAVDASIADGMAILNLGLRER